MPYTVTETSKSRLNTFQEARDYAYRQSNSFSSVRTDACSLCNSEFHKCLFDFFHEENLD